MATTLQPQIKGTGWLFRQSRAADRTLQQHIFLRRCNPQRFNVSSAQPLQIPLSSSPTLFAPQEYSNLKRQTVSNLLHNIGTYVTGLPGHSQHRLHHHHQHTPCDPLRHVPSNTSSLQSNTPKQTAHFPRERWSGGQEMQASEPHTLSLSSLAPSTVSLSHWITAPLSSSAPHYCFLYLSVSPPRSPPSKLFPPHSRRTRAYTQAQRHMQHTHTQNPTHALALGRAGTNRAASRRRSRELKPRPDRSLSDPAAESNDCDKQRQRGSARDRAWMVISWGERGVEAGLEVMPEVWVLALWACSPTRLN